MADLIGDFSSILGHDPDWKSILGSLDTDQDRRLDYNEFLSAATNRVKLLNDENLKMAFQVLDKNGDGKVSAQELQETFATSVLNKDQLQMPISDDFWEQLVAEVDKDQNGFISFEEFKETMLEIIEKEHVIRESIYFKKRPAPEE